MTSTIIARSVRTANASTPTTIARAAAAKSGTSRSPPISVGPTRRRPRQWSCAAAEPEENTTMPGIQATYLEMPLQLADLDHENLDYFRYCAAHDFHLQACSGCGRLRYPPTTACPWCMTLESEWRRGRGKGGGASHNQMDLAHQPRFP